MTISCLFYLDKVKTNFAHSSKERMTTHEEVRSCDFSRLQFEKRGLPSIP
nr:MAG TPA: hypothetical protein [Caudoviricetes sp.]